MAIAYRKPRPEWKLASKIVIRLFARIKIAYNPAPDESNWHFSGSAISGASEYRLNINWGRHG